MDNREINEPQTLHAAAPAFAATDVHLHWRWRVALTIVLLLMMVALALLSSRSAQAAPAAQSTGDPLTLAFYYSWFDEGIWSYDQLSDLPAEQYVSRDRAAMGRHIEQAQRAGIDALVVAWYGPGGQWNQTEPNLVALLEEAAARNFKIAILFETTSPFFANTGDVQNALAHALTTHVNHPAFLRVDGRPVIFFWKPTLYGVEGWRAVRSAVDPNFSSIWISEGVDTSYLSVFDGHHLYSNTWSPPADLSAINAKFAGQVAGARAQHGTHKYWVATAMPGYDDIKIRPGYGFAQDREGGAYYERSWQAAIGSSPDWVVITSFNEWPEGSYIEPSVAFGDHYLNLTTAFSAQFKAGGGATVNTVALPAPLAASTGAAPTPAPVEPAPVEPAPLPEPDVPTAYVDTALLNLRAGPGTDFAQVGQVEAGAALSITGRQGEWWRVDASSTGATAVNGSAWIFGPLVRAAGPLEGVPTLEAPALEIPTEEAPAAVSAAAAPPSDLQAVTSDEEPGAPGVPGAPGAPEDPQSPETITQVDVQPANEDAETSVEPVAEPAGEASSAPIEEDDESEPLWARPIDILEPIYDTAPIDNPE